MKFSEMIEGLQILAKYEEKGLDAHLNGADHDVIWAASAEPSDVEEFLDEDGEGMPMDTRLTEEDHKRLVELGWFVSEEYADAWTHYC